MHRFFLILTTIEPSQSEILAIGWIICPRPGPLKVARNVDCATRRLVGSKICTSRIDSSAHTYSHESRYYCIVKVTGHWKLGAFGAATPAELLFRILKLNLKDEAKKNKVSTYSYLTLKNRSRLSNQNIEFLFSRAPSKLSPYDFFHFSSISSLPPNAPFPISSPRWPRTPFPIT